LSDKDNYFQVSPNPFSDSTVNPDETLVETSTFEMKKPKPDPDLFQGRVLIFIIFIFCFIGYTALVNIRK